MAYIYCITNKNNGKQYIGKTNLTVEERWREHCYDAKKERCEKRPLYSAINKYGAENFEISILEECSAEDSSKREEFWIKKLNTYGKTGYNATMGGDSKKYYDYEELAKAYLELGTIQAVMDKYHCDRATVKIACKEQGVQTASSKTINQRNGSIPVVMLDKDTLEEIKTFISMGEAIRYLNKPKGWHHISAVCKGKRKTAYGYKWKFKDS